MNVSVTHKVYRTLTFLFLCQGQIDTPRSLSRSKRVSLWIWPLDTAFYIDLKFRYRQRQHYWIHWCRKHMFLCVLNNSSGFIKKNITFISLRRPFLLCHMIVIMKCWKQSQQLYLIHSFLIFNNYDLDQQIHNWKQSVH